MNKNKLMELVKKELDEEQRKDLVRELKSKVIELRDLELRMNKVKSEINHLKSGKKLSEYIDDEDEVEYC